MDLGSQNHNEDGLLRPTFRNSWKCGPSGFRALLAVMGFLGEGLGFHYGGP